MFRSDIKSEGGTKNINSSISFSWLDATVRDSKPSKPECHIKHRTGLISFNGFAVTFCRLAGFGVTCHVYNLACHLSYDLRGLASKYILYYMILTGASGQGLENTKVGSVVLTV